MPAISFSVETARGKLWRLIVKGEKRQTLRKPRTANPIEVGQELSLYWKQRTAPENKPGEPHLLAVVKCIEARRVDGMDLWHDTKMAQRDGFSTLEEFRQWIAPGYKDEFDGDSWQATGDYLRKRVFKVIRWAWPPVEMHGIIPRVEEDDAESS